MRKVTGIVILMLFAVSFITSCKKDDKKGNSSTNPPVVEHEIKYRLVTNNPGIAVQVQYTDAGSNLVTTPLGAGSSQWTESFTTTQVPFEAYAKVTFNNPQSAAVGYTLVIYVDNQAVVYEAGDVPPASNYTATVEFIVE